MALTDQHILQHPDEKNLGNAVDDVSGDSPSASSVTWEPDWTKEEERKLVRK